MKSLIAAFNLSIHNLVHSASGRRRTDFEVAQLALRGFTDPKLLFTDLLIPIQLPKNMQVAERIDVSIEYETTDKCTAVQQLNPEQTFGGKYSFM
jgi:hypothetical protein